MAFKLGKRLIAALRGREKSENCATVQADPGRGGGLMDDILALDGIEKKYAANSDYSHITNTRLANVLSGRLEPKAFKQRRAGSLHLVHFSKQVLVTVTPVAGTGTYFLPFTVEKFLVDSEPREHARFLIAAEFFNDAGAVLHPEPSCASEVVGVAQVYEVEDRCGEFSACKLSVPPGTAHVLLSLMTVDPREEVVLLSDFALSGVFAYVPVTAWAKRKVTGRWAAMDLSQPCSGTFRVLPKSQFVVQISAESFNADGLPIGARERALVLEVEFFTGKRRRISGQYPGMASSKAFQNYVYISSVDRVSAFCSKCLQVPSKASWLRVRLVPWEKNTKIKLNAPILFGTLDGETAQAALDLDAECADLLAAAEGIAAREGRTSQRRKLLQALYRKTGRADVCDKLRSLSGTLRELDEGWVPSLPVEPAVITPARRTGSPTRICHLHKVAYPYENSGGAIRNLNIVKWQKAAGLQPFVILPLFYPFNEENRDGFSVRMHEDVPYFEFRWSKACGKLPLDRLLEYNSLLTYSVVRALEADVIHAASGFRGYELALQGIALREKLGIPLIYEVRSFHEHTWGPSGQATLEAEYTKLRMQKEDYCMRAADHVVTISESMRDLLVARGIDRERIEVVPNGVDGDKFIHAKASGALARERHNLSGYFVVGYISNMSRREGHDVLIQAVAKLIEGNARVKCLLVGDGPERQRLEKLAQSLGIAERCLFTGEVDHQEIHGYYRAMDLFVVPRRPDFASDYVTPLKPYEAMALGVPIIVSDRPALREIVGDGQRGMLFEAESVDSLVSVLREALANRDRRLNLARAARTWIMRERTWEANCRKYLDLYDKVIAEFAASIAASCPRETAGQ